MGRNDPRAATNARSAGVCSVPKVGCGEALNGQIVSCRPQKSETTRKSSVL